MGARQRAQARTGKVTAGENNSPWSGKKQKSTGKANRLDTHQRHRALIQDWQNFSDSSSAHPANGFLSMSQEARNTERHAASWGSTRLRDHGVTFVSAGNLARDDDDEPAVEEEDNGDEEDNGASALENNAQQATDTSRVETPVQLEPEATVDKSVLADDPSDQNAVPEAGQEVSITHIPVSRKPSISSQSSEEIVFCGRQNAAQIPPHNGDAPKVIPPPSSEPRPAEQAREPQQDVPGLGALSPPRASFQQGKLPSMPYRSKVLARRGREWISTQRRDEEEAIMNDYIANLAFDDDSEDDGDDGDDEKGDSGQAGRKNEHFRFFDGSAQASVKVQTKPAINLTANPTKLDTKVDQAIDWDSADLEDFDDLGTTDDEIIEVSQVLRHRVRPSGRQYLVTAVGHGASDARWVLASLLQSASALDEIRIFEEIRALRPQEHTADSDDDDDDDDSGTDEALDDLVGDIESEDDENARILKHTSRMTDEQIARALAKQEELGMGGDELLLFDGQMDHGVEDEDDDEFLANDNFIAFSSKKHLSSRGKSKRNGRQRDNFPPAETFADALEQDPYGAFDIMDFDRPSLRPRKKGAKGDFPFDFGLQDEELAQHLRSTWNKDRDKKVARKHEKMEAREAALLEVSERSDPAVIKAEIRQFLVQENDTLKLSAMDSATRAAVHRLAKALKLKSHSVGKEGHGTGRCPVLTKGVYTPSYTIDTIWEVDALMNTKKFFPKHHGGTYRGPNASGPLGAARARRGGGGTMSGATYMNGEVVGASAPEIGSDNKGRAMLEKMGWTSGMGIGAVGNKGGLDAIKHVVKTTRAGLG